MRSRTVSVLIAGLAFFLAPPAPADTRATEFCLKGEFDLGRRMQGMQPAVSEFHPARWCVATEQDSGHVQFLVAGHSNPDMSGSFRVSYLPPDAVRIVNRENPPDLEFAGAEIAEEARRYRRIDPRRAVEEIAANPDWVVSTSEDGRHTVQYPGESATVRLQIINNRLHTLETTADLPLRGRVPVHWNWDWHEKDAPRVSIEVEDTEIFRATGSWKSLDADEATTLWQPSGDIAPREIPGDAWPSSTTMRLEQLAEHVYLLRGVRTGFHHIVIETEEGLVIGDAPAGWVELPQIPPADLVPGLGISGLSEQFIDFLGREFPDREIHAVALTHAHDDHAGGARAFAAAGADVYAPAPVSAFLESALNSDRMPADRLDAADGNVAIHPVANNVTVDANGSVELVSIGAGPHVSASLGVWAIDAGFFFQSDLHVPNSDSDTPREDRLATECWFARWAVEKLPPETTVLNSHSTIRTPVSRLASYAKSDECA